ncbi:hypothetical protein IP81_19435, partial [Novosphingobium sp. AAP83]|uniref:hypothetical protein n=1 Tax=Novosphingobium sp. AAP83 TaxID=1523425 RepID=UPI0006CDCE00
AADITAIETANGSGTIDGSALTAINGTAAAVVLALDDLDTDPTNFASTLTGTTATASDLNVIDAATSVTVNATSVTALSGSTADVAASYASAGISGLGNETVTLSSATAAVRDLLAINEATSGNVNASAITTLTGTLAEAVAAILSTGIVGLGNESVTLSDHTLSVVAVNALNALTTGMIDASSVSTFTGSASEVAAIYAASGITGIGATSITIDDTILAAADLNALTDLSTGTIDVTSVLTVAGSAAVVAFSYVSTDITGLGNEAVTLTGVAAAGDITTIAGANGSGTIDGSAITAINGTAAAVVQAVDDLDTDPSDFNSALMGAAEAADITAIETANG